MSDTLSTTRTPLSTVPPAHPAWCQDCTPEVYTAQGTRDWTGWAGQRAAEVDGLAVVDHSAELVNDDVCVIGLARADAAIGAELVPGMVRVYLSAEDVTVSLDDAERFALALLDAVRLGRGEQ